LTEKTIAIFFFNPKYEDDNIMLIVAPSPSTLNMPRPI